MYSQGATDDHDEEGSCGGPDSEAEPTDEELNVFWTYPDDETRENVINEASNHAENLANEASRDLGLMAPPESFPADAKASSSDLSAHSPSHPHSHSHSHSHSRSHSHNIYPMAPLDGGLPSAPSLDPPKSSRRASSDSRHRSVTRRRSSMSNTTSTSFPRTHHQTSTSRSQHRPGTQGHRRNLTINSGMNQLSVDSRLTLTQAPHAWPRRAARTCTSPHGPDPDPDPSSRTFAEWQQGVNVSRRKWETLLHTSSEEDLYDGYTTAGLRQYGLSLCETRLPAETLSYWQRRERVDDARRSWTEIFGGEINEARRSGGALETSLPAAPVEGSSMDPEGAGVKVSAQEEAEEELDEVRCRG